MKFTVERDNSKIVCTFKEAKWDYTSVREIENDLLKEFESAEKIIFDLINVEFIASAFIRLCLEALKAVGKDNFEIINAGDFVATVLQISHFDRFIKVSTS